ncbi:MAG: RIP metalloprotease RseP [Pseudomonadota bacterium]
MDIVGALSGLLGFITGSVIPFLFVLTIVVFFHELGHFLVARWNKVTVEAFAVGFGPELIGFNDRQGTRWKLCAVPLGGYVRFMGDEDASSKPDHEALAAMSEQQREGAFEHKAIWQKAAVVAAGPIANFLLAIVIYTALFMHIEDVRIAPIVGKVIENSAAEEAGLQVGDRIVSIDGTPVTQFADLQRKTMMNSDQPLRFVILRDGAELTVEAAPRMTEREDRFGNAYKTGLLGISPDPSEENIVTVKLGFGEAFMKGLDRIGLIVTGTFNFIAELVVGKQDASELRGPLGIGQMTSQVATLGILQLLSLAAVLSVSIGLLNLLPVPVLDGGHLVFYALEAIRGKPLGERAQEIAYRIGLTCILGLMLFATSNDIMRFLGF